MCIQCITCHKFFLKVKKDDKIEIIWIDKGWYDGIVLDVSQSEIKVKSDELYSGYELWIPMEDILEDASSSVTTSIPTESM